jgi:hypothetical protein
MVNTVDSLVGGNLLNNFSVMLLNNDKSDNLLSITESKVLLLNALDKECSLLLPHLLDLAHSVRVGSLLRQFSESVLHLLGPFNLSHSDQDLTQVLLNNVTHHFFVRGPLLRRGVAVESVEDLPEGFSHLDGESLKPVFNIDVGLDREITFKFDYFAVIGQDLFN